MTAAAAAGAGRDARVVDKGATRSGTVQSIERAFGLLETMADHGGMMGLSQLAAESGLPLPTIHRLLRTLVDLGYLRQDAGRQYVLAPRLIRLGESSGAMLSVWAKPHLDHLVAELGESANLAMLDGDQIVYVAQAQSRRAMRMLLRRTGMPEHTEHTITDPDAFAKALIWVDEHGYAIDDEEQEHGVRCVAVAVPDAPTRLGLSVSGPATRMTPAVIERTVPILRAAAADLSHDLA
jgi:IclR family acetate operon transcriptional repressor